MSNTHGGARPGAGRKPTTGKGVFTTFTKEQQIELESNEFVYQVSDKTISFTKAFKDMFWRRYLDGVYPSHIFDDANLDPKIITSSRIYAFTKALKTQAEKGLPFTAGNQPQQEVSQSSITMPVPPRRANNARLPALSDGEIAKLINKVSYMEQEIAFLKKIILSSKEIK